MKITKRDFDKAVARPYTCSTCLLNQALKRNGLPVNSVAPQLSMKWKDYLLANHLQTIFDAAHNSEPILTPDERLTGLALLRAILPMDV